MRTAAPSAAGVVASSIAMIDSLHTVWMLGELLGIRCVACDHRAVLSPTEFPEIRRANMTRLRDLKLRCGHCGVRGHEPDQFTLCMPEDREQADSFMRGHDAARAAKV